MEKNLKNTTQENFLNLVRKQKRPVTIFLVNGIKLQGTITGFDTFALALKKDERTQLVYKHAVSTVMPTDSLSFGEEEDSIDS